MVWAKYNLKRQRGTKEIIKTHHQVKIDKWNYRSLGRNKRGRKKRRIIRRGEIELK